MFFCSVTSLTKAMYYLQFLGPYSVSKTALLGLTKALSHEAATMNVRVNCLAPGVIKTKFSEQVS